MRRQVSIGCVPVNLHLQKETTSLLTPTIYVKECVRGTGGGGWGWDRDGEEEYTCFRRMFTQMFTLWPYRGILDDFYFLFFIFCIVWFL